MKVFLALLCLACCSCRTAMLVTGARRPPTNPDAIVEYMMPPQQYVELGKLSVDAYSNETPQAIDRLHMMAARLGANAILMGPAQVDLASDGPRETGEKPRVAEMTTYEATAIWVSGTLRPRPESDHF